MKKQSKPKKPQMNMRIEAEEQTRLAKLGASAGFSSANQFVIEAMRRYGDLLAEAIIAENAELKEASERHRERLRAKLIATAE